MESEIWLWLWYRILPDFEVSFCLVLSSPRILYSGFKYYHDDRTSQSTTGNGQVLLLRMYTLMYSTVVYLEKKSNLRKKGEL